MPIKIEQLKSFLGFGDGLTLLEYYYSQGMRFRKGGIEPGWEMIECARSSTVTSLDFVQDFAERDEGGDPYIYAADDGGDILKVKDALSAAYANYTLAHTCGTSSHGNGLITDHSSSQRLLYIQDEWVGSYDGAVWYDTFMDLGWSLNIAKSSDIYEDWVVIPNGSTVALLNITDDSKNYNAFSFPADFLCSIARSGRNGVLLGANFNEKGVLALWDCQADRSLAPWIWTKGKIYGIAKYDGIWVVSTGREFLITDGYNILKKYSIPDLKDSEVNFGPVIPTGMKVEGDKLIIGSNTGLPNRRKTGSWILDLITGLWEFCPLSTRNTIDNASVGAVFISSRNSRFISYTDTFLSPNQEYIGRIYDSEGSSCFVIEAGAGNNIKKRAEAIILDLSFSVDDYTVYTNPNWKVTVKLYNFRRQLWAYGQAGSTSSSAIDIPVIGNVSGYNEAEVGDEITILEGVNAGSVRHIASILREDAANEIWVLDKALNTAIEANAQINILPFKEVGRKAITIEEIKDNRLFIPIQKTQIGRKFLIKLVFEPTYMRPHIKNISFVYDELTMQ